MPGLTLRLVQNEDLHTLRTNPEVFPFELMLTSGDKLKVDHPDDVFYSRKPGKNFYYPEAGGGLFAWIEPGQITKIRGKIKRGNPRAA